MLHMKSSQTPGLLIQLVFPLFQYLSFVNYCGCLNALFIESGHAHTHTCIHTDTHTLCTLGGAQGQIDELNLICWGNAQERGSGYVCVFVCACARGYVGACVCDQSSKEDLIPSANHIRVLLNVIICTLRRRGEGEEHLKVSTVFISPQITPLCHT